MPHPQKTVAAITALAIAISEGRTTKELVFISEILSCLNNSLRTIAAMTVEEEVFEMFEGDEDDNGGKSSKEKKRKRKQA